MRNFRKSAIREDLDFEIDADEKLYDHAIPRLILQPLVENSLNHGVLLQGVRKNLS